MTNFDDDSTERPCGDPNVVRAKAGDRRALSSLLEKVRPNLQARAQQLIGDAMRAKVRTSDLVQSALLEAIGSLDGFEGESEAEFAVWIGRILENNVRDQDRRFHALKRNIEREEPGIDTGALAVVDDSASPSSHAAAAEEALILSQAITALPDDYRRMVLMYLTRQYSHAEAAQAFGRSVGACRILWSRARAALTLEVDRIRNGRINST